MIWREHQGRYCAAKVKRCKKSTINKTKIRFFKEKKKKQRKTKKEK